MFCFLAETDIVGEVEGVAPVNNFAIRIVGVLCTKRRPTDEAFEHDSPNGPPVAAESIALAVENFGSDVIWGPDRGVGHNTTRFAPGVDLATVADCEIDLVQGDRVAVAGLA